MPISPFGYPLDLSGVAPTNTIIGEVITFTSPETRSFVPAAGPFYVFNMALRHSATGVLLAPKVDYLVEYLLPEPSMASGKEVAGIVRVINTDIPGVSMDYHVIGGSYGNTVTMLQTYLDDNPILPINPIWGEIPDAPVQYPPAAHLTDMKTVFGLGPLVNVIEGVRQALLSGDQAAWGAVYNYLNLRLTEEHLSILSDVTALQRPVPMGPVAGQVLMSLSPTPATYGWGDYVPIPPGSAKVLISTGTARGDWVWGDPSAASLPTPPTTGQVLRSTGNMPGDWDWSPSGIEPRFDVFMYAVDEDHIRIAPRNGGYFWVNGVNRQLVNPITLTLTLSTDMVLYSVFLQWNGTELVPYVVNVLNATDTPRMGPNGVVCSYDTNIDVYHYNTVFVGHYIRMPNSVELTYPNMGKLYVRSYHHDAGTTVAGSILEGATLKRGPRPFSRNGTRLDTALYLGERLQGVANGDWGVGWNYGEVPYLGDNGNLGNPPYDAGPSTEMVLGTIVWPFEQIRVAGHFNCYASNDVDSLIALRTWGFGHHTSGTPTIGWATILERAGLGWDDYDGHGSRIHKGSLETVFCTDMVYTDSGEDYTARHHLASFRIFDMIWNDKVYMHGQGDAAWSGSVKGAGASRLIVQPITLTRCLTETTWPGNTGLGLEIGPAFY